MRLILSTLLIIMATQVLAAPRVQVVTEELPPYNFSLNGEVLGNSTDIVRAVLDKAELNYTIDMVRWSRAYKLAQTDKNTLIYSILRTETREHQFKWVAEVSDKPQIHFYTAADRKDIKPEQLEDAKRYIVGTMKDSASHIFLKENRFPLVSTTRKHDLLIKKLLSHRLDLILSHDAILDQQLSLLGKDKTKLRKLLPAFEQPIYMAFSLQTDDALVEKVRQAYSALYPKDVQE